MAIILKQKYIAIFLKESICGNFTYIKVNYVFKRSFKNTIKKEIITDKYFVQRQIASKESSVEKEIRLL